MKAFINVKAVSGGFVSPLSGTSSGKTDISESFDNPIIGYTQTFLYTRSDGHDISNQYEAYYFVDVYEITPIYAMA